MSKIVSKFISVLTVSILLAYPAKVLANDTKIDDELTNLEEPKKEEKKETPKKEEAKDLELENMLNGDINAGSTGSFGYNLNKMNQDLGIEPYVHAYTTFDAKKEANTFDGKNETTHPFTFDNTYYNLFVGVTIKDLLATEVQYENEHGGSEYEVRVGQIDLLLNPLFNLRFGKFLVPIGSFNPYLYPEYITKSPAKPFALSEIIPVTWSDVGFDLFGKYEFGINKNINYNLFAINGLKDTSKNTDSDSKYVGNIRAMRGNNLEEDKSDKGLGGRVGITPIDGLELSFSGYTGSYTADSSKKLSIGDIDLAYELGNFTFRSEYVYAIQQAKQFDVIKKGGYAQISYLLKPVEPVVRFDLIDFSNDTKQNRQRVAVGLNYYPIYDTYKKFVMKAWYTYTMQQELKEANSFYFQTSLGF